jgi:hypothetical protein
MTVGEDQNERNAPEIYGIKEFAVRSAHALKIGW